MIEEDFPLISEVNQHLLRMRGKMFRPTLVLLADQATGGPTERAATFAAVIEVIHLATLVHDDSVDHSTLRRGMPTINALFSHQVSVIMGDFLYSRAVVELVRLGNLDALRILSRVTTAMTVGEMRQLLAARPARVQRGGVRPADQGEDRLADVRAPAKSAPSRRRWPSAARWPPSARSSAWSSRSPTTCSTTPPTRR